MTIRPLLTLGSVAFALALSAQPGRFTTFGKGCALPGAKASTLTNTGVPTLGSTMSLHYSGPNAISDKGQRV